MRAFVLRNHISNETSAHYEYLPTLSRSDTVEASAGVHEDEPEGDEVKQCTQSLISKT